MMARSLQYRDSSTQQDVRRSVQRAMEPRIAVCPKTRGSGECNGSVFETSVSRIEYNLFAKPEEMILTLTNLEEAEREWLQSMNHEGWPVRSPDFFQRQADFGSGLERVVPLRHPTPARTARPAETA